MQFNLKTERSENIFNLMRRIQYHFLGQKGDEFNFSKPLGANPYPRFHIYLQTRGLEISGSIHLDQKKASYGDNTAHSGEYDGEILEKEVKRIRESING